MSKETIDKDKLLKLGWVEGTDPIYPMSKVLSDPEINEEDHLRLVVHQLEGGWMFAVSMPDGGLLNFVAHSTEELQTFEKMIHSYNPTY